MKDIYNREGIQYVHMYNVHVCVVIVCNLTLESKYIQNVARDHSFKLLVQVKVLNGILGKRLWCYAEERRENKISFSFS